MFKIDKETVSGKEYNGKPNCLFSIGRNAKAVWSSVPTPQPLRWFPFLFRVLLRNQGPQFNWVIRQYEFTEDILYIAFPKTSEFQFYWSLKISNYGVLYLEKLEILGTLKVGASICEASKLWSKRLIEPGILRLETSEDWSFSGFCIPRNLLHRIEAKAKSEIENLKTSREAGWRCRGGPCCGEYIHREHPRERNGGHVRTQELFNNNNNLSPDYLPCGRMRPPHWERLINWYILHSFVHYFWVFPLLLYTHKRWLKTQPLDLPE